MGAYVVTTSSLNEKHSCQLFRMSLRDKTTPILNTPLIRAKHELCGLNCLFLVIWLIFLQSGSQMCTNVKIIGVIAKMAMVDE